MWNEEDYESSARESERKARYWEDMADRHKAKCKDCAEQISLGYGHGCNKWWGMREKGDKHRSDENRSRGIVYRISRGEKP